LPSPNVVNLQLWTIPFELDCYAVLAVLGLLTLGRRTSWLVPATGVAIFALTAYQLFAGTLSPFNTRPPGQLLILAFLSGVWLYNLRRLMPFSLPLFAAACTAWWLLAGTQNLLYLAALPIAYATVYLGLLDPPRTLVVRGADYSYGLYLYGFPIQQSLSAMFPGLRFWWLNVAASLALAGVFAWLSWTLVESRVLAARPRVLRFIDTWLARLSPWRAVRQPDAIG
jgi:peptidoglycan/LPS O-acetylase OafA/YrhL